MTRGTMTHYMRRSWPQSEALAQARREHSIDWRAMPSRRSRPNDEDEPSTPPAKRQRQMRTGGHFQGREVCKPFNDARGCTKQEKLCPLGRIHVCDAIGDDGQICGSRAHSRAQHK